MHYCQDCAEPVTLIPAGPAACCPACGSVDPAVVRAPLFVVTGASGAGKSTVLAPLARALAGLCVTFDVDYLLDAAGELAGAQPMNWEAFSAAWLAVAHGAAQSGLPTVLLGPVIPDLLEALPARRWIGSIHYLLLDCPDHERRGRIEARPVWRGHDVDEQVEFGRWLRANIPDQISTSGCSPQQTAATVASWVSEYLSSSQETGTAIAGGTRHGRTNARD